MENKTSGRRRAALASLAVVGVVGGLSAGVTGGFGLSAAAASVASPAAAKPAAPKPFAATPAPAKPAAAAPAPPSPVAAADTGDQRYRDIFYTDGYTYDDAVALSKLWHGEDPFQVKADAGKKLEAGETLPIGPGSTPSSVEDADDAPDLTALFFVDGYTYGDAVKLAALWHSATPYDAKVAASKKLAAGETLPVAP